MYNKNKVHINILASKKSGYLSSIMLNGRKAGLMFQNKKILEKGDNNQRLAITFEGSLNCSVSEFTKKIESHPEIHLVESFSYEDTDAPVIQLLNQDNNTESESSAPLNAHDIVDSDTITLIEKKLSDYLGPIAPFLVQSAKASCFTIGELFVSLSKELKGEEKESFLSLVDLSNTKYLSIDNKKPNKKRPTSNASEVVASQEKEVNTLNLDIELFSHDKISPESLQIAENKLSKTLGPVAKFLVQSAAEKNKHIGDLFLLLSEELEGSERSDFLELVSGVDLEKLEA